MSVIAEAMSKMAGDRRCSTLGACSALVAASQAAALGNVIAGVPRTSDIEWIKIMTTRSTLESWSEWRCHAIIARQPADDLRPCWDATARAWRWGSPACDPRGCAWPRPWVGGEVRRG